ncbi:MAG: type II toxin-antitoxin system RelE/ParE family toxin [Acidobacteria bacterium]|nr:type II toxin-antitoxin system RelE/ParE family toxin [Acidobacteriota bacterium]MCI0717798.1 type II toxin-antitoxin system RelE/ParE family toxin [Acidobacteriota bacterium]
MKYAIILSPEALEDLRHLKAPIRSEVKESIEIHLRHEPLKESKSRIKRLRGIQRPEYRLRIGEIRVFYDVSEDTVEILAVIPKSKASDWLERLGESK